MNAREAVTERVARRARRFPLFDLSPLDAAELDVREAAFAAAIDHAVARHWLTLEALLARALDRDWENVEPRLQAVLLVGAAQLVYLDAVPAHAAIDESVSVAKRFVRERAGGLVNAVLRRLADLVGAVEPYESGRADQVPLSDGRARRLAEAVFDGAPLVRLAAQTGHPLPLVAHWADRFGAVRAEALARHSLVHAPILLSGLDRSCSPHEREGYLVFGGSRAELAQLLAEAPSARVQDPTSALPVAATAGLAPSVIVDACAGRGTKTRQLAALHPEARIIASDADPVRVRALRALFGAGTRVEVVPFDALLSHCAARVDLLVLDVPCTNTGVLARRVEAKYRWSPASIQSLAGVQRQIVADTLPLLADGGRLLYATCSLEPAENEEQLAWLSHWHPFTLVAEERTWPSGLPGEAPSHYADGGYFALVERR